MQLNKNVHKYFVPNFTAYLAHNINIDLNLANQNLVQEYSLEFVSYNEKILDNLTRLIPKTRHY